MEKISKRSPEDFPKRVKERIDFIYNLLKEYPSGYKDGFASYDSLTRLCVTKLLDRGAVTRVRDTQRRGLKFVYKWAASMAPTKVLYKNIIEDIHKSPSHNHALRKVNKTQDPPLLEVEHKLPEKSKNPPVVGLMAHTGEPVYNVAKKEDFIHSLTAQELWDELKSRGAQVLNGEVVIVQKLA